MTIRLLIAPDSFKQCRDAESIADLLKRGAQRAAEGRGVDLAITTMPMSDGGEGFLDVIRRAIGGEVRTVGCTGVDLGSETLPVEARWLWHAGSATAFGETAEVVGFQQTSRRNPWERTAVGIGEYLLALRAHRPRRIVLGVGGTSTMDGGASVVRGLGARFYTEQGPVIVHQARDALAATRIELGEPWGDIEVECWCDVSTPLTGPQGAAVTFAPQKGATDVQVEMLAKDIAEWAARMAERRGVDPTSMGTGAGGGIPFGVQVVTGARILRGGPAVGELLRLPEAIRQADLIWTGEGRVDPTTIQGKLVGTVLALARPLTKPVHVFAGQCTGDPASLLDGCPVVCLGRPAEPVEESIAQIETRLVREAENALAAWIDRAVLGAVEPFGPNAAGPGETGSTSDG